MRTNLALSLTFSLGVLILHGCSSLGLPDAGFVKSDVKPIETGPNPAGIQIVDVTDKVARELLAHRATHMFSDTLGSAPINAQLIGPGDVVEVTIWEAPPATLFGAPQITLASAQAASLTTSQVTTLPDQMVDSEGFINVPFVGQVKAAGRLPTEIEAEITKGLKGKANQPQVLVRVIHNVSSKVTVVGDVTNSTLVPLTPRGEKLLDALAAAGGVRQPVDKMTIQVTRDDNVYSLPLETIIKDPRQNVPLHPGDVVTALFQPLSFTALGATGKNEEINFEAQGITLAQALARTGGLIDNRADAQGVFIFRFEPSDTLKWPHQPVMVTPDGKVPVIYRVDLKNPETFFVAQSFPVENKDLLYVTNAPLAEVQKFLNVIYLITSPALNAAAIGTR
ncbi:MAG TPA: polysaccharide biosynthesis/export family protein [Burkholderiales bacterium]|nr:polysaccharide biosynthesis/export family protein [Burkholderiales bacterium]